jgi:hypothetical protein
MSFNWKQFLISLAALAPTIVAGTAALAGEAGTSSKIQLATDSANLATGVADVLTSGNDQEQAVAGFASQITKSIIIATSQAHAASGLPTLHTYEQQPQTTAANQQGPALAVSAAGAIGGTAKQVG